jgi:hypothetical protein
MKTALVLALVVPRLALADIPDDGTRPDDGSGAGSSMGSSAAPGDQPVQAPFHHKDIVVTSTGERSSKNIAILASIAGAAALIGGLGVYYNLDSKSAADEVSAHRPMSVPWTTDRQATYDRAHDSAVKAEIFYGVGGALLIGAVVGLIVTQPKTETTVIHPHVAVGPGGAVLGGSWSF